MDEFIAQKVTKRVRLIERDPAFLEIFGGPVRAPVREAFSVLV
jgi:hypothetical protein